jgi:hypothetical protein
MKINLDDIDLQDIYIFMENGDVKDAPEDVVYYLQLLDKIHGMHQRRLHYGTEEAILKHLILVDGFSRYKAKQLYDEMREYFYKSSNVSKDVYRNIYAERMENLATATELTAKTPEDFDRASRIYERAGKMRQLDLVDPPQLPKELFQKPIKIFAMDPEFLGQPKINRLELAKQIDELDELSESEKLLLKQDAAIEPIKLFNNEQEVRDKR